MEKIKLVVTPRESKTPNLLRREGKVPATLYGRGVDSQCVQVDAKEFSRLPSAAYTHMIELDFGDKKGVNAIIRNVQRKSTNSNVLHIEFYKVALDRKLTMAVPLKFSGTAPAVTLGGQLIESFQEVEIECLPGDIPDYIEVDLGHLKEIEDSLHFGDLKISDKIKILNPHDEIVVKVVAPRTQTDEAAPAAESQAAETAAAAS